MSASRALSRSRIMSQVRSQARNAAACSAATSLRSQPNRARPGSRHPPEPARAPRTILGPPVLTHQRASGRQPDPEPLTDLTPRFALRPQTRGLLGDHLAAHPGQRPRPPVPHRYITGRLGRAAVAFHERRGPPVRRQAHRARPAMQRARLPADHAQRGLPNSPAYGRDSGPAQAPLGATRGMEPANARRLAGGDTTQRQAGTP
jgi:hypothetical protein